MSTKQLLQKVELRDLAFVAGVGLLITGGFQISRPWTLVALGGFLIFTAIWRRT